MIAGLFSKLKLALHDQRKQVKKVKKTYINHNAQRTSKLVLVFVELLPVLFCSYLVLCLTPVCLFPPFLMDPISFPPSFRLGCLLVFSLCFTALLFYLVRAFFLHFFSVCSVSFCCLPVLFLRIQLCIRLAFCFSTSLLCVLHFGSCFWPAGIK